MLREPMPTGGCRLRRLADADLLSLLAAGCTSISTQARLCRNDTSALVAITQAAVDHHGFMPSLLLRVGGPHIQTSLFERRPDPREGGGELWVAPVSLCEAGRITLHARVITGDPHEYVTDSQSKLTRSLLEQQKHIGHSKHPHRMRAIELSVSLPECRCMHT